MESRMFCLPPSCPALMMETSMTTRRNQHVVPHGGQWAVRGEGNTRLTSTHATQADAIGAARQIAVNQGSELVIHRSNGQIRDMDSHGHDPYPPRG